PDAARLQAPRIEVPFRSTLKKLESKWVGPSRSQITGKVRLLEGINRARCRLDGKITNNTPHTLIHVYLAFIDQMGNDALCYIPVWEPGRTIDLQRDIEEWNLVGRTGDRQAVPGMGKPIADLLQSRGGAQFAWTQEYLFNNIRSGLTS